MLAGKNTCLQNWTFLCTALPLRAIRLRRGDSALAVFQSKARIKARTNAWVREQLGDALGHHWHENTNADESVGTPAPSCAL